MSFTCDVLLCIFCDIFILRKRFYCIMPSSMAMQERMPSCHGSNDTINITIPAGKDAANIVEAVKCCS